MDKAWKSIKGFIVSFTFSFDQLKIQFHTEIKKKTERVILENFVSHYREGIYASFSATIEVIQWIEVINFSSSWFWVSGIEFPLSMFRNLILFKFFFTLFFYRCGAYN